VSTVVRCPIAGTVFEIHKKPGERVTAREPVITLECMKMEIPIEAPIDGRVLSVDVNQGDSIVKDQQLFVLEP
jgi:acetyl-CoA carboxylase biotin carboxyl carrier protein